MDKNKKFIVAYSADTATLLKKRGFKIINQANDEYIFINDESKQCYAEDVKDVVYTNKLFTWLPHIGGYFFL